MLLAVIAAVVTVVTAFSVHARGASGDILYVKVDRVNVRQGASTKTPVLITLNKGHELLEIYRQEEWIQVGVARTGGKIGWIHRSLVTSELPLGGKTTTPLTPEFENFMWAFNILNHKVKSATGVTFFTEVEDLADGIIRVTATDTWLSGSRQERESNLRTIYKLWKAANDNLPVAVYIVGPQGKRRMTCDWIRPCD
jgi:uncharacterized protein YgiM (DUF1202 family)